ncbi:pleckstrin homology domain-containing family B member 2-like isoform X2 [Anneissia japonica]|uniref:pleckstrin homology domain-containing family B member 2-like isoform X2 n=1 Tax=Anneissia japonica TaxID=1529436 RepID=UPI00142554C6|nr:pleckstrin homology domain-containing family B member 2-like isoform X2 [Anneissia japonica]
MATSGEAANIHGVVKSGWMQRQSDFLRRWKRQYCVLYSDGGFSYFTDETRNDSQGVINLPSRCCAINIGHEVRDVDPPADRTNSCLIELKTTSTGNVVFCADSPDEAVAWKSSLTEAKLANTRQDMPQHVPQFNRYSYRPYDAPPPYSSCHRGGRVVQTTTTYPDGTQVVNMNNGYPRQTRMYSYPGQTYYTTYQDPNTMSNPAGTNTTVIYNQDRRNNTDAAFGFATGAAVGALMFSPILFW